MGNGGQMVEMGQKLTGKKWADIKTAMLKWSLIIRRIPFQQAIDMSDPLLHNQQKREGKIPNVSFEGMEN